MYCFRETVMFCRGPGSEFKIVSTLITVCAVQYYYFILCMSFLNTILGVWSSPLLKGGKPPPCAFFSFTKVDQDRVVLFGGCQSGYIGISDLYLFDLSIMVSCCD